jgi:hypothetical protein
MHRHRPSNNTPRRFQFSLVALLLWVGVAAVVCFFIRNLWLVVALGSLVAAAWFVLVSVAVLDRWDRVGNSWPMRIVVASLLLLVAIPFSPVLLLCVDWAGLFERLRRAKPR